MTRAILLLSVVAGLLSGCATPLKGESGAEKAWSFIQRAACYSNNDRNMTSDDCEQY